MERKKLNVISFNVPYPADYGGVIDVFYKIRYLNSIGVDIILHTFEYGRKHHEKLNEYCSEVYYYKRKTGIITQLSFLPYIVKSRENIKLLSNLNKNDYPILFEGLHTCYYLSHPSLKNRIKLVRTHNIEHEYYQGLAKITDCWWKRIYFETEALRLKRFEKVLHYAQYILPLSDMETEYFSNIFSSDKVRFIPIFHQNEKVEISVKTETPYLFFHGDLSVQENIYAVNFLIRELFQQAKDIQLVVAGKNPGKTLINHINTLENVDLIPNPCNEEMDRLLQNAAINILYVRHAAGVKLKLLNSLYKGRFCFANEEMTHGSMLEDLCVIFPQKNKPLLELVYEYYHKDFDVREIEKREELLSSIYDNKKNAGKIATLLP